MFIFRIEDNKGAGPLRYNSSAWISETDFEHFRALPPPGRDEIGYLDSNYVCGCVSLDQLCSWFVKPKWLTKLSAVGYAVVVRQAKESDVKFGKFQVAIPKTSEIIDRFSTYALIKHH